MKKSCKYVSLILLTFFCLSSTATMQDRESTPVAAVRECNFVYVLGIENKVMFAIDETTTLLQAIEDVDGKLPDSKVKYVRIYRLISETDREVMRFRLKDLKKKKVENPVLQPCDIVEVESGKIKHFRFISNSTTILPILNLEVL